MLGAVVGCEKDDSKADFGFTSLYMPQALSSGGIDSMYLVPSGNGEMTYNFKAENGKIEIMLGVMLSGKRAPDAGYTVDIKTFSDITDDLIASGAIHNAVAMPADMYTLPAQATTTGDREAAFYLSVDSAELMNNLDYLGENLILTVGLSNPTRYPLSNKNTHTTIVINRDALYSHFFKYKEGFLYRKGTKLMLNGKDYQCAGINSPVLSGCGSGTEKFSEEEIDNLFASLPDNVLVRTWAFSGNRDKTDKIIKAAERNNIKLILVLADQSSACEDNTGDKDEEWFTSGFKGGYLAYIKDMASAYKNSPAVGMWEMLNEPTMYNESVASIKSFYNEAAKELKAADPNHLVATGAWANWAYNGKDGYQTVHDSKYIDVGTYHESDQDVVAGWSFADCQDALNTLDKVLIVDDVSLEGGDGTGCFYDKSGRAGMVKEKFGFYLDNGAGAALISYLVKEVSDDCSSAFGTDDPIVNVVEPFPANKDLGK